MKKIYEKYRYPTFLYAAKDGRFWWFSNYWFNGLFKLDTESWKTEFVEKFQWEENLRVCLYSRTYFYDGKIFLLPQNSNYIAIYVTQEQKMLSLHLPEVDSLPGYGTAAFFTEGDRLYLFSAYLAHAPVALNMKTFEFQQMDRWQKILNLYGASHKLYLTESVVKADNAAWVALFGTNIILKLSLHTQKYEEFRIEDSGCQILKLALSRDKDYIWIIPDNRPGICKLHIKSGRIEEFYQYPAQLEHKTVRFVELLEDEGFLFLIPAAGRYIIRVDGVTGKMFYMDSFPKELESFHLEKKENRQWFRNGCLSEQYLYLYPYQTNGLVRIDKRTWKAELIGLHVMEETPLLELISESIRTDRGQPFYPEAVCPVEVFLDAVIDGWVKSGSAKAQDVPEDDCGEKIWRFLRS